MTNDYFLNKMNYQHKNLLDGKWFEFSLAEQMANVGAEIGRAINWRKKEKYDYSQQAFFRGLELLSLTIDDSKNKKRLKELCRLKEILGDYFIGENEYNSDDEFFEKYFYSFNYLARNRC